MTILRADSRILFQEVAMSLDNEQYRLIVESSPNMIWRAGEDALCNYFNATWLHFTGKTLEEEAGNGWAQGVHPDDFDACLKIYLEAFSQRKPFEMEYRLKRHDGEYRWINDRGVPLFDENRKFFGYIGSCMDVTDKVEGARLREMAQNDGLTRIYNRQYFEQLARIQLQQSIESHESLFLIMIDVNQFKHINDQCGHQTGDLVLKEVANALASCIRETDLLGRYGGDEFILLIRNAEMQEVMNVIEKCKTAIESRAVLYENKKIITSASFGIKQRDNETDLEKLIVAADKKMYENKGLFKT